MGAVALCAVGCDEYSAPVSTPVIEPVRVETVEPCAVRTISDRDGVSSIEEVHFDPWMRRIGRRVSTFDGQTAYSESWAYDVVDRLVAYTYIEARWSEWHAGNEPAVTALQRTLYEQHGYDAAGNRTRTVIDYGHASLDPVVITRVFDAAGRPLTIERRAGATLQRRQTFAYDAAGRVVEQADVGPESARTWRFAHDADGRLVERLTTIDGARRVERWAFDDDGAQVEATIDRDGDGRVDYREQRLARRGGFDETYDEGADDRVERRVSTRVDGMRETVTTDRGDDGVPERVVVTVRDEGRVWVGTDDDADGQIEGAVETLTRERETEVRTDLDGDGVFDLFETTRLTAEGEFESYRMLDAEGVELRSRVGKRSGGRLVEDVTTEADNVTMWLEYFYDCNYNPYPPTTERPTAGLVE